MQPGKGVQATAMEPPRQADAPGEKIGFIDEVLRRRFPPAVPWDDSLASIRIDRLAVVVGPYRLWVKWHLPKGSRSESCLEAGDRNITMLLVSE